VLRFGDVTLDPEAGQVHRSGAPVELTHLQFELLHFLLRHPGRVFSREQLLERVWGLQHSGSARTVDNFIRQLRTKLEADPGAPQHILTVRGSGYRFGP
jgi:DNA-binding response OmpR family regulator